MNILIIGGSGFISGTLAARALEQGHQVQTITRGNRSLPPGVSSLIADRDNAEQFAACITFARAQQNAPWDLVVDCICQKVEHARQDIALFRDRARNFVFISTDFVFDPTHRQFPQDVDNPHFLHDGYGGNKRLCEEEFLNVETPQMNCAILRPCHVYGPGSQLGCLPEHGRDPHLIEHLRAKKPLRLAGGGYFLQQPIYAADLADLILSCADNLNANKQIYQAAGPDIIESRRYYEIIADLLNVPLQIEEVAVDAYKKAHPEHLSFLCHRIYDLDKLRKHQLQVPATPIEKGLQMQVETLLK